METGWEMQKLSVAVAAVGAIAVVGWWPVPATAPV